MRRYSLSKYAFATAVAFMAIALAFTLSGDAKQSFRMVAYAIAILALIFGIVSSRAITKN